MRSPSKQSSCSRSPQSYSNRFAEAVLVFEKGRCVLHRVVGAEPTQPNRSQACRRVTNTQQPSTVLRKLSSLIFQLNLGTSTAMQARWALNSRSCAETLEQPERQRRGWEGAGRPARCFPQLGRAQKQAPTACSAGAQLPLLLLLAFARLASLPPDPPAAGVPGRNGNNVTEEPRKPVCCTCYVHVAAR